MKIEFIEKNYDIGKRLKEIITKKISKLDRYFTDDAVAKVLCKQENKTFKLELTIKSKGMLYRSEVIGENMYENIDFALPKIERQVIKQYEKRRDLFRTKSEIPDLAFLTEKPNIKEKEIIRTKTFELVPTTLEEAKDYIDAIEHNFYVFLNAETGKVNILYNRDDKRLGLIICDY